MSKAKQKGKQTPADKKRSVTLVPSNPEMTWIIEPHDPLIVRDGRPFGPDPSARAISLSFPFPSTTTGGARSRAGLNSDGTFDLSQIGRVKQIKVRGPLLVQLSQSGENIEEWMVPAPADALLLEGYLKRIGRAFGNVAPEYLIETSRGNPLYYLIWAGPRMVGRKIAAHVLRQGKSVRSRELRAAARRRSGPPRRPQKP